ncbi:MFS transporter [uncultured Bacteroides sp.]|uniref:MFS transporter n=1 Tax=uncultured Bacteroides sp. TaxID=162156 RepID=UPI0037492BD7
MKNSKRSPWAWIPTLYFAEGLPYVAVMTISVIMYKRLGISNTDIALYTSWLYLPWVIKPFWSPFVDLLKTKRWWIVTMQLLVGAGLAGIAFTIPMPNFFQITLAIFWLVAFSSATHDIAADGFYMLALDTHDQAMYVGIRSTFYRVATIAGQGLLIVLAGGLEQWTGIQPAEINVKAGPSYSNQIVIPSNDRLSDNTYNKDLHFIVSPSAAEINPVAQNSDSVHNLVKYVEEQNQINGFVAKEEVNKQGEEKSISGIRQIINNFTHGLSSAIRTTFGEKRKNKGINPTANVGVVKVCLSKCPEEGKEIVLNTSFNKGDQSISLVHGDRIVFTSKNWSKPAFLILQVDPKLKNQKEALFKGLSGNISLAWSITFFVLSGFFIAACLYHKYILPKPTSDQRSIDHSAMNIFREFFKTFVTFFKKKQVGVAMLFMLLYRLPEAQLVKLINPFLLDPKEMGGLGLTTSQVGWVYGTIGILGLTVGGIIGGIAAAKGGLKRWLWPMAWSISLTCITFVYLSYFQPDNLFLVNLCVFIEQFGYGFGFTAYMLFLIYYSDGEHKTAHYAICTAFMALGMMLPGMAAGWLQELIGYKHFFVWVMICCAATIAVCAFVKIDPEYGKKKEVESE